MTPDQPRVALLAPMVFELRPLVTAAGLERSSDDWWRGPVGGASAVATHLSMGTAAARAATEAVLERESIDHAVVVGIAGGVLPHRGVGDLVVPERVLDGQTGKSYEPAPLGGLEASGTLRTSDEFLVDDDALAALAGEGVVALDMETAVVAAACQERGVPWSVVRVISDVAQGHPIGAAVLDFARADGSPRPLAVARYLARRPWKLPALVRLGRDGSREAATAARIAVDACAREWPVPDPAGRVS